jgi:hypothetical protein
MHYRYDCSSQAVQTGIHAGRLPSQPPVESIVNVCRHNAAVATHVGRGQIAQTWLMLELLYTGNLPSGEGTGRGLPFVLPFTHMRNRAACGAAASF